MLAARDHTSRRSSCFVLFSGDRAPLHSAARGSHRRLDGNRLVSTGMRALSSLFATFASFCSYRRLAWNTGMTELEQKIAKDAKEETEVTEKGEKRVSTPGN